MTLASHTTGCGHEGLAISALTEWSPLRFARQSALGHRRGQTLALVAVSALITACTAFAPVYDRAMQQALVDTLLAQASTDEKAVTVQSEATVNAGGATEARDPRDLQAMVPSDVAARLGPPVLGRTAFVTPVVGDVPPTGPLVWREGACEHVRVLSGSCPGAPGEILVSEADVENFGLALGSTPTVTASGRRQPGVPLEVVGTYAPRDDSWWQGLTLVGMSMLSQGTDPSAAHDAWLTTEETFVDGPILPGRDLADRCPRAHRRRPTSTRCSRSGTGCVRCHATSVGAGTSTSSPTSTT